MAIQKPYSISLNGKTIDALTNNEVSWSVSGSVQTSFSLEIVDNVTSTLVWSLPKTASYSQKYTISGGTLENGKEYKIRITVWNEQNESATSDYVIFQTSSRPVVTLSPIGTVGSPNFVFQAQYDQSEGVPLRSWIGIVYDENQNRLSDTGIKTTTPIEYVVNNLKSETHYFVEFQVTSNKGLTSTTGLVPFYVLYTRPQVNVNLTAENVPEVAGIRLSWNPVQVILKANHVPVFIDNEKIDLRDEGKTIEATEGFSIANDFTLKMWIQDVFKLSKGITGETFIIVSANPPSDQSAIWVYDPNQLTEKIIGVVANNVQPANTDNLWIEDANQTTEKSLTPYVGEDQPSNSHLWIDVNESTTQREDFYLLKLFGDNGDLKLWYEDNRFHVNKDIEGIISHYASPVVLGTRFFVALRQIGSEIDIYCESY